MEDSDIWEEGHFYFTKKHIEIVSGYDKPIDKLVYLAKHYGDKVQRYRTELLWNLYGTYLTPDRQPSDIVATPVDSLVEQTMSQIRNEIYRLLRQHYHQEIAEELYGQLVEATADTTVWMTERETTKGE